MTRFLNHPLPDGHRLGDYVIESVLSRGGFSIVYRAMDAIGRPVVIKEYMPGHLGVRGEGMLVPTVRHDQAATFRYGLRCFFEEGRLLADLRHPNVVRVFNFFRANDTAYLVMRYEHGRTLHQHVQARRGAVTERALARLFVQLLSGLREVHARRLLHLDIKPANIFVRNDGAPVLIDFGGARRTLSFEGGDCEPILRPIYTPGFAPIELYQNRDQLGPWSDIYEIGASLYAVLAGKAPPAADLRAHGEALVPAAVRWRGRYSEHLLQTIDWCLAMVPEDRPQSVLELQQALQNRRAPRRRSQRWFDACRDRLWRVAGSLGLATHH